MIRDRIAELHQAAAPTIATLFAGLLLLVVLVPELTLAVIALSIVGAVIKAAPYVLAVAFVWLAVTR